MPAQMCGWSDGVRSIILSRTQFGSALIQSFIWANYLGGGGNRRKSSKSHWSNGLPRWPKGMGSTGKNYAITILWITLGFWHFPINLPNNMRFVEQFLILWKFAIPWYVFHSQYAVENTQWGLPILGLLFSNLGHGIFRLQSWIISTQVWI